MKFHDLVRGLITLLGASLLGATVAAQSPESLSLKDAKRITMRNHPQIQAGRARAAVAS
jgi:hypothetical protein